MQYNQQTESRMVGSNQYSNMGYYSQQYPCNPCIQINPCYAYQPSYQMQPCPPCPPCQDDNLVDPRPIPQKPAPKSRIQYRPVQRSVVEYQVRERVQKKPVQRVVTEYKQEKRKRLVPVQKQVTDYYAIQKIKQYVPQYKQQKKIQQIPAQRITYKQELVQVGTKQRVIKPQQRPDLFYNYKEYVAEQRRGEWRKVDVNQIDKSARWIGSQQSTMDKGYTPYSYEKEYLKETRKDEGTYGNQYATYGNVSKGYEDQTFQKHVRKEKEPKSYSYEKYGQEVKSYLYP